MSAIIFRAPPSLLTAVGRCLVNEVRDWKRRRIVSWLKKLNVALGSWLPSLSLKKSCTYSSILFGYSASRLLLIPVGRGYSLNPCNFNGCRRIRKNFVQFLMNWSKFSPQGNDVWKVNHAHNKARKAQLHVVGCRTCWRLKLLCRLNSIFLLKVKIPLGLNPLQQSMIIHFVWENFRLLLATEYFKCTKHSTYYPLGKCYAIGRYLHKLSHCTLLARAYFNVCFLPNSYWGWEVVCAEGLEFLPIYLTNTVEWETWNLSYSCSCLWLYAASDGCCCLASETPAGFQFYLFPKMNGLLQRFSSFTGVRVTSIRNYEVLSGSKACVKHRYWQQDYCDLSCLLTCGPLKTL